ncbi:hypothetical protein QR680_013604 [Steinernema hermaphroditum]|uniref:Peptidase S1 domain-containing protein n=1 Tax=Steinernema hermaphroditum TaxID=289476 RepID=A0AA39I8P4_9BILA|nr:hypothetical protein QR680_013604 [Steinernema hermaphroditum]
MRRPHLFLLLLIPLVVSVPTEPSELILGGNRATQKQFPFHVRFIFERPAGQFSACGGTLLDERHILTAAHCLSHTLPNAYAVAYLGLIDREDPEATGVQSVPIKSVMMHPDNPTGNHTYDDIAVLELADVVKFTEFVQPIKIVASDDTFIESPMGGVVMGFGVTSYANKTIGPLSRYLLYAKVPFVEYNLCKKRYGWKITNKTICADTVGKGVGEGDSGGPLVIFHENEWIQMGITAWTTRTQNRRKNPSVYTRISKYCTFIEDVTKKSVRCL